MQIVLLIGTLVCVAVYTGLVGLLHATQDKREPRPLATSIPFLGPIIGGIKHKVKYLLKLHTEYQLPICTLRLPFSRIYIVNAPALVSAVQRHANNISFGPVGRDFGFLFSGLTQSSQDTLKKAYDGSGNGFTSLVHQYLKNGPFLCEASRAAIEHLAGTVPNWASHGSSMNLFYTVRHTLTMALTDTVYGPQNPFRDSAIEEHWLKFLPGISHLMYSPLASITARKHLQARDKVIMAFEHYFATDGHLQGTQMIQDMYKANKGHGLNMKECAKMEIATSLAILSSGSITAIWFILHILSDATVLSAVRKELLANLTTTNTNGDMIVDLSKTKTKCPTLMAVLSETFRYHSTIMSAKTIDRDVVLNDIYLLKAGSLLIIPGPVVHHDPAIWGITASIFDHHRFLDTKKNPSTASFRPFGSGASMCPGRHFSTNAILALTAIMVLKFDVSPEGHGGQWVLPTTEGADLWNAMPKLDHDVPVDMTPYKELETVKMKFVWGDGGIEEVLNKGGK